MIAVHSKFNITEEIAQTWLKAMNSVTADLRKENKINLQDKELLDDYFNYTAYYLIAANEGIEKEQKIVQASEKYY